MARKFKSGKIRLLLVDDHPLVRDGLKSHLRAQRGLEVVGEASNGLEAIRLAADLQPDVILMDITMPQMNGLEATTRLRRGDPTARVLILTMHDNREYVAQMMRNGASGYLRKDGSPAELVTAIKAVHAGETFFSPTAPRGGPESPALGGRAAAASLPDAALLTEREREVLTLISEGLPNKQIADRLGIGVRTAETYRERVMDKLGIRSVAGLTKYAIAHGMTSSL